MSKILEAILPNDINTRNHLFDTFGSMEKETVARNIIVLAKKRGSWEPFTWEEYKKGCTHSVTESERYQLNALVEDGALSLTDGRYMVTSVFIAHLSNYIID